MNETWLFMIQPWKAWLLKQNKIPQKTSIELKWIKQQAIILIEEPLTNIY